MHFGAAALSTSVVPIMALFALDDPSGAFLWSEHEYAKPVLSVAGNCPIREAHALNLVFIS
jgi:hypothetical protein